MVSVASGGTVDRIAARILFKVLRAGSGTPARYSSTFFGAPLPFAAELRLPDFTFFMRAMLQEAPIQVYASARRAAVRHEKCHTVFRHTCTCPYSRDYRRGPIKGNVKRKISPSARCRHFFVSAFSPTCLNVHSRFESGLAQAESLISFRRPIKGNVKRKISPSARCRHFFVSAFSPTCLNVHSRFESGLAQVESRISVRRPVMWNVKRKISPSARCRHFFVSAFSPTCLNVHSRFESGLAQVESRISVRRPVMWNVKRKISPSARCRHFFVSAFSPTCLNVHSRFESGLAQVESRISVRRPVMWNVKRKISPSARCRHFFVSAFSPTCLNVHSRFESGLAQAESLISFRRVTRRNVSSSLWFHTLVATAPFVSETSSLTVIHFMSGNAWSYRRLVAYGFLGLSKCEVIRNVELARQDPANRGLRYFQLHIST